ncbi:chaplin [Kitasatospora sp. NPDC058115]|uniref:chaplin n=1 Tax=Kitasatospora sp. NPDC058115 TaxID=3346347 RepID=UPI0036DE9439
MRNAAKKGLLTAVATGSVLASTAGYAYAGAGAEGVAAGSPGVASGNSVQVPIEVPINACGNTIDVIGLLNPAFGNNCANSSGRPAGGAHAGGTHTGGAQTGGGHPGGVQTGGGHQGGAPSGGAPSGGAQTGGAHTGGGQAGGGQAGSGAAGAGSAASGATASGTATGSPGVISGNSVQAPVHVPVNACGNSVDVVGALNPAYGNTCVTAAAPAPVKPAAPQEDCPEEHAPHNAPPPAPPVTQSADDPAQGTPRAAAPAEAAPVRPAVAHAQAPAVEETGRQLAATGAGNTELLGAAGLALLIGGGVLYRRARAGAR